jgi:hypothetical protein
MVNSIPVALILMITRDSWQSSMRVTCSRPSFGILSFHPPRNFLFTRKNNKRTYSQPASANNESYTSSASNTGGVHSARELLRLSRENELRRTITTASPSSISNINQQQCFTWPQLLKLFRTEIRPDNTPTSTTTQLQNNIHYISSNHPNLALFRRVDNVQQLYEEHKTYLSDCWVSAYDHLLVNKFGNKFGFEKVVVPSVNSRNIIYRANLSLAQATKDTIEKQLSYLSLVPNDFPYHVDTNIEHWCLWKIGKIYNNSSSMERNSISMVELSWAMDELKTSCNNSVGNSCIIHNNRNIYPTKIIHTSTMADDVSDITKQSMIIGISGKENEYLKKTSQPPPPVNNTTVLDMLYWINPPHLQSMPEIHHAHFLVLRS